MCLFTFLSRSLRPLTNIPQEASDVCLSYKLLRLYGLIASDSTGVYAFGPDFFRSMRKLENLVDKYMLKLGAQRVQLPTLGPRNMWEKSGRWSEMHSSLFKLRDRLSHDYCLQPTHEECITSFVTSLKLSYKSLPVFLYQITSKFRDEPRPKNGLIRGREFLMQDLYTFDASAETAEETYEYVKTTYAELLASLNLPYLIARADPGHVGGLVSDEFHVPAIVGEDRILMCSKYILEVLFEKQSVAHCFLLGERYSKCFNATYRSISGSKLLFMGCYGLGISRLLAVCIEYLTRVSFPDKSKDQITQLRWPAQIAPYSGAIVLQKETAKDSLSADELKSLLDTIQSGSINLQLPGDILVDDRKELSLGRKVLDQSRLGVPWILIGKSQADGAYELIDVYKDRSCAVTLEEARSAFSEPTMFDTSSLPSWKYPRNESNISEKNVHI
ncbi:putative proline--tRNA ligase, mitochondrial [Schistosoma japonicum]|nr:putative proline--tRNA ligase, mitochondrial [Schistosoma japonicum]